MGTRRETHNRDEQYFERLYLESFGQVYRYVLSCVSDARSAEDITAEAYLRAARNFGRFDETRARFSTWVIAIARNCLADYFKTTTTTISLDELPDDVITVEDLPTVLNEDAELVRSLLATLSKSERAIVRMRYLEGKRNVQIAKELGINQSTVASRLQRALAKMRNTAI
ncbi:MAG: sigma-70 family RNA polymerase sigma factor [Atopobiaceae bacterium]|nr:sigma-70 family RNA polymerase sigma factor [Atopobiaceae bacterium]